MTIKELCMKYNQCCECPFSYACVLLNCDNPAYINEDKNISVTKSIIETAKELEQQPKMIESQESEV